MKHIIEKHTVFGELSDGDGFPYIDGNDFPALISDLELERGVYALRFAQWLCENYVPCGDNLWTPKTGPNDPKTTGELFQIYNH